jgi:PmbA protein
MITRENKELANWAMRYALSNGCSDVRVSVYSRINNSFEYRDTQLDKLGQANESGMTIQLFVDGRYASYSTNRINNRKELERYIKNGIEATRYLAKDELRKLPAANRYYKGDGGGLDTVDANASKVSVDEKLALIRSATAEVYGTDPRLISVTSGYGDGQSGSYMVTSNGFEGEAASTYFGLSTSISIRSEGDERPTDFWSDSSIYWDKLQKQNIGKTAYERVIRKLGAEKIASANFPMLMDNTMSARLLSPIMNALNGNNLHQKNSFLIDKIGQKIVSDKFTLIDDPHIPQANGARWFDNEGVATIKRTVIEKGVLRTYYIDTYASGKLETEPTVQSASTLVCEHGNRNFDQILASLDRAIWVTGFNGGNSNSTTGDFSFGIDGFLIENGKVVKPINEMNITGNILTLWNNLLEVGNDPRLNTSSRIPTVLFDAVSFSGV